MPDSAVTVVIPLFNKVHEVSRTLESVLQQSSPPVAVVVVDDGSTDGGDRIVEQHSDPRVRLIRQPNAGPGPARNRGIDEASTDLVALIDADDEWLPGFLETALQLRSRWRGLELSDEVGQFLLRRTDRSSAALFALLDKLDQAALMAQRRLTVPFVKSVLADDR